MAPSDDKKIEILYSHYADTFVVIQSQVRSRDRFFAGILVILAVMSFQVALPTESGTTIAEFVKQQFGIDKSPNASFLGSVIWAGMLFTSVRYFQLGVGLERHYRYIHSLEEDLSSNYAGVAFTREGKFYLGQYPLFSWSVARLYRWIFPIGLVTAVTIKIGSEYRLNDVLAFPLVVDTLFWLLMVVASTLYFLNINLGK